MAGLLSTGPTLSSFCSFSLQSSSEGVGPVQICYVDFIQSFFSVALVFLPPAYIFFVDLIKYFVSLFSIPTSSGGGGHIKMCLELRKEQIWVGTVNREGGGDTSSFFSL